MEPNNVGHLVQLGYTYNELNLPEKAIEPLEKVFRTRFKFAGVYYELGRAYSKTKQFDKAAQVYKVGTEVVPDIRFMYAFLAREYHHLGKTKKEKKTIKKMISLARQGKFELKYCYGNLGVYYLLYGYTDEAIEFLQKEIELESTDVEMHKYLGRAFDKKKDWEESIKEHKLCLELEPTGTYAYYYLGKAYQNLNQIDKAIEAFQTYLAKEENGEWSQEARKQLHKLMAENNG